MSPPFVTPLKQWIEMLASMITALGLLLPGANDGNRHALLDLVQPVHLG